LKVCITGGAGFIGSALSRVLVAAGHDVTVVDSFNEQIHGPRAELAADLQKHVHLIRGDVREPEVWEHALPGQQVIVHLAAETGTGQSMYEVTQYQQVNLGGTANLYQLLATKSGFNIERIVVASSRAIYGEGAYLCANDGIVYPRSRSVEDKNHGYFDPLCPICAGACQPTPTPESAPFQPASFYGLTKQVQEQIVLMFSDSCGFL
jgi:dTDP-L-rhamnose 4-epimerase